MAEHEDAVTCFDLGVTIDQDALFATYQSADGDATGQTQRLHGGLRHTRSLGSHELGHFAVGQHQCTHVTHVGLHHHLEDMAGGHGLLVDDGTDVQALGHGHIVQVLDHGNGLAHAQLLGRETGQDIGLGIARQRDEGLRVLDAFLTQQAQIASVAMDDHDI